MDDPQLGDFPFPIHFLAYTHTNTHTEPLPTKATRPVGAGGGAVVVWEVEPPCDYTVPGDPGHHQGSRWGRKEDSSLGMGLGRGVSFWGRATKIEAAKRMERGAGAH